MHTEYFSVNNSSENEKVEYVTARLPDGGVAVFLLAFFVEAVYLSDLPRLVVATDKDNPLWVSFRGN
jgi:hypothetical protein